MKNVTYNSIGKTYDSTRKADPVITQTLLKLLQPEHFGKYLDLACGSGNYTIALHQNGLNIDGIDISDEMLNKAKLKYSLVQWYLGNAENTLFDDNAYNGVVCTLATHHMNDLEKVFQEVYRITKVQSKFVILTATPEQMRNYWLNYYFPVMIESTCDKMKNFKELEKSLICNSFSNIKQTPFFVDNQLQDLFLQSGKYRPEIYLDENVRKGIVTPDVKIHH
jgi:ubiquinone/menaquinone biosynthesis C-methylase UbiE